jgi:hypothetical protein
VIAVWIKKRGKLFVMRYLHPIFAARFLQSGFTKKSVSRKINFENFIRIFLVNKHKAITFALRSKKRWQKSQKFFESLKATAF